MKDLFSKQSLSYAQYRPNYPDALVKHLVYTVSNLELAWDCGTGNGQMASLLSPFFEKIYATDISENQIQNAHKRQNIEYSIQPAEKTNFENHFFDLVTVCQAVHWFDFDLFYQEVRRVAKKNAILALIGYNIPKVKPEIDKYLNDLYTKTLGSYWDKERKYIDEAYSTIPFPFQEIILPQFSITCQWNINQYIGYLNTWSAVQHYIKKHGDNPIEEFYHHILPFWNDIQTVSFPIFTRVGKII